MAPAFFILPGVMVRGRWLPDAEIQARLAALAAN